MKLQLADDDTDGNKWSDLSMDGQLSPVSKEKYIVGESHKGVDRLCPKSSA